MNQPRLLKMLRLMTIMSGPVHFTIDELADRIETSHRSIFRYIDTLRSAGFIVDRTINNRYRLLEMSETYKDLRSVVFFSEEEAKVLAGLINGLHESNGLKRNLYDKLATIFEKGDFSRYVDDREKAFNIESLSAAMKNKEQVLLRGYSSANAGVEHDALVEPYDFSKEYVNIYAYDIENRQNRVFKVSRISKVEKTEKGWQYESLHKKDYTDVFRMMGPHLVPVKLKMTMRAKNLLIEEYPMSESYVTKVENHWELNTEVTNMAGVGRFVMGLCKDVCVVDSPELSEYITSYLSGLSFFLES